ncbi:hypothetical protein GE09DRAFT_779542 [Coniochaeta sp. 2T2.1]|nr:hypothetical protein GE09DRAFT_779542 [Coniochaeta sp. 2T2.1]
MQLNRVVRARLRCRSGTLRMLRAFELEKPRCDVVRGQKPTTSHIRLEGSHRPNPCFPHDGHVTTISTRLFNGSSTERHVQVPRETQLLSNLSSQRHEDHPQTGYRFAVPCRFLCEQSVTCLCYTIYQHHDTQTASASHFFYTIAWGSENRAAWARSPTSRSDSNSESSSKYSFYVDRANGSWTAEVTLLPSATRLFCRILPRRTVLCRRMS